MTPLDFYFEFGSTYSYPTALRIGALAAEYEVEVRWRAFLLGPIFGEQGWNDSPFNLYPAKGRYMWRDLERICDAQQIAFTRPSVFPRNGLSAARIAVQFAHADWQAEFVRAVYRANFEHDLDISKPEIVRDCLAATGADAESVLAESQSPAAKAALRAQTETAAKLGLFGAPSFVVGDELFWGNDRLEDALRWAADNQARA